jgi:hypothetical protein
MLFCFNAACQFKPLLNLCPHFWLNMPCWLCTMVHPSTYTPSIEKIWMLCAHSELHQSLCKTTCFVCCLYLMVFLFCLPVPWRHTQSRNKIITDTVTNNCSNNLNTGNLYDLCIIKWLSSNVCESEFNHLW